MGEGLPYLLWRIDHTMKNEGNQPIEFREIFCEHFWITSAGFFSDPADPPSEDRRTYVGGGFPSSPTVVVANDPGNDVIIVKTSEGPTIIAIDARITICQRPL